MGVTSLWSILHPCARPIKLETLNRKRLAIDASIWIYQFLKAVRDKEGNALRNSHVVGFFRRICKLLFFGIKPVFVFDGGAPVLKRKTVTERKRRREGRREDAVRTAGRLLAVQMQRRAEEEEERQRGSAAAAQEEPEVPDEALVYVDEIGMSAKERDQTRKFRRKDAYHLPNLETSISEMGDPDDPRVMSLEELQNYARQFESGEDINVYDFSKIDYDSPFFTSLPPSDRYNILNAARLRSRLRMGHSKEQLDTMFPDRMAFSKFQIERVTERNELTQRLMHLNEGGDVLFNGGGRVAGEKGREYVLVKNDGVEGGWALGVISDEGTKRETAIDLDKPAARTVVKREEEDKDEEADFEDVPIEGLNRLPKRRKLDSEGDGGDVFAQQRRDLYRSRKSAGRRPARRKRETNPLFVTEDTAQDDENLDEASDELDTEEQDIADPELFGNEEDADPDLERAIAMSLESTHNPTSPTRTSPNKARNIPDDDSANASDDEANTFTFNPSTQTLAPEARPMPKGSSGRALANLFNKRAFEAAPESREVTSFGVPVPKFNEDFTPNVAAAAVDDEGMEGGDFGKGRGDEEEDEDEDMDFQAALAASRKQKQKNTSSPRKPRNPITDGSSAPAPPPHLERQFSGPLPFEKLNLGASLLGKKKMSERSEAAAGGFVNPALAEKHEALPSGPLPPWFVQDPEEGVRRERELEREEARKKAEFAKQFQFEGRRKQGLAS